MQSQLKLKDLVPETNVKLMAARVVEGYIMGIHESPFRGFSAEFEQHRPYQHGDDLRYFDWKVWAKSEKKFIRQFEEETNLLSTVILDSSASMAYPTESQDKWVFASVLAASFIHILLKQRDAAGLVIADEDIQYHAHPKGVSWVESTLFEGIESIKPSGESKLDVALNRISEVHQKRGLIILISDFMYEIDTLTKSLTTLRSQGHDIMAIQVLHPTELSLESRFDVQLEDLESGKTLDTNFIQLQADYQQTVVNWKSQLELYFRNYNIDLFSFTTEDTFSAAIRKIIQKRKALLTI